MRITHIFALSAAVASPLTAQIVSPGLIDRARQPDGSAPITVPEQRSEEDSVGQMDFAPPSPGDSDLGMQMLLKRQERIRMFWAQANIGVFGTDNAARLNRNEEGDAYFSGVVALGFQPQFGDNWFLDLSVSQEFYRYNTYEVLDFESTDLGIGLFKVLSSLDDLVVGARYGYRRMTSGSISEETYSRNGLALSAQKTFLIDRKNSWYVNATADFDAQSDPEVLERYEYAGQIGYDFRLTHDLKLSAFYRYAWRDYQNADLDEGNHILGVAATVVVGPNVRLETSAVWTENDSDLDALDYTASSVGLAANFRVDF